jgi:hypothetical protein
LSADATVPRATLVLLAAEWWKANRRLLRLAAEAAPGRLDRERAQAAYATRRIEAALEASGLRLADHTGQPYSPVNPEDFETEEGLEVADTIEPTVLAHGRILQRGKVVLRRAGGS